MNNHAFNYVYPPDFAKANKHRLANRIFKGDVDTNAEECECCGKRVGEEEVETSCGIEPSQLSFLGPGIPLFFLFLKFIIFLLLVMSIFFMGFAIFSNVTSNDCGTISSCLPDIFNTLSLINKKSKTNYMEIQSYLGLVFVAVCILFFHYFRFKARILKQECDEVVDSPSDYAIILRKLPPKVTEDEIRQLVEEKKAELTPQQLANTCQLKINKIVLSYSLKEYNRTRDNNLQNFKTCIKEDRLSDFKCEQLPKPTEPSQMAIIVFESQAAKDYFKYAPSMRQKLLQFFCTPCIPLSQCRVRGEQVGVERAPEPDEIYWHNSGITMNGAIGRKVLTGVVSIVVLMVGGAAQYGLSLLSNTTSDSTVETILTTASSLIVTIFNVILMLALSFLTKKQRNQTETEDQTVLMVKVTMFQFLNAGIFVIISEIAANYSTFTLNKGICSQITLIMVLNAIIPNATLLFLQYSEIINKAMRYFVEKGWLVYTQAELNQIFIGSAIELPNKYAYILKTLWLTALYSPLIPVVVAASIVGLILFYFVQKFLYTRSYCMPSNVSSMSYESAVELLEYFLITFSMGELIIYFYFYNFQYDSMPMTWTITILATVSLSILNSALPMEAINDYLFPISNSSKSELTYSEVESKFEVTYEMTNPAYQTDRRKRNPSKGNVQVPSKANANAKKASAMELTTMLNDSVNKNAESIMTQKPLLKEFIDNQAGEEQRQSNRAKEQPIAGAGQHQQSEYEYEQEDEQEAEADQYEGLEDEELQEQEKGGAGRKTEKQPKVGTFAAKQQGKLTQSSKTETTRQKQDTTSAKSTNKDMMKQSKQKEKPKRAADQEIKPKNRKYLPKEPKVQKKTFQIVDPFQDLSSFKPPAFVIRWREEQAEQQRQRILKEKEEQKLAAKLLSSKKLPKLPQQSVISKAPLLSPSATLENNLDNIYANLLAKAKNESIDKNSEMKLNPVHISVENVPIASKYHQSGGKANIYSEFIDPNHKPAVLPRFKKQISRPKVEKPAKNKESQIVAEEIVEKSPKETRRHKEKDNQYKFVVVHQVPLRSFKKYGKFNEQNSSLQNEALNDKNTYANISRLTKSQKKINIDVQPDINQAYKEAFGKSSHLNSRSSLHNDYNEAKQQQRQRRAIYNPISIEGSYKKYFKSRFDSDAGDTYEGFLDKRVVMSYIGTPFVNLAKNMPADEQK